MGEATAQSMDKVETTLIQTPKLTKVDTMNGDQVSYKVALLANQDNKAGETKSEVRRFVVPQDCSTSMVYLKEKLRFVITGNSFSKASDSPFLQRSSFKDACHS